MRPDEAGGFKVWVKLLGFIPIEVPQMQGISILFEKVGGGDAMVSVSNGVRTYGGERIELNPISPAWEPRPGEYLPDDGPFSTAALEVDHGMLRLRLGLESAPEGFVYAIALEARNDGEAVILGRGRNTRGVLRARGEGDESVIEYLALRLDVRSATKADRLAQLELEHPTVERDRRDLTLHSPR